MFVEVCVNTGTNERNPEITLQRETFHSAMNELVCGHFTRLLSCKFGLHLEGLSTSSINTRKSVEARSNRREPNTEPPCEGKPFKLNLFKDRVQPKRD